MRSRKSCVTLGFAAPSTLTWVIPHPTLSTDESAIALWQKPSAIASSDVQTSAEQRYTPRNVNCVLVEMRLEPCLKIRLPSLNKGFTCSNTMLLLAKLPGKQCKR